MRGEEEEIGKLRKGEGEIRKKRRNRRRRLEEQKIRKKNRVNRDK